MGCLTEADLTNWVGESGRLLEISDSGPFVENRIEGGTFIRGCVRGDPSCEEDEQPAHKVTLSYNLWVAQTELQQDVWDKTMSYQPQSSIQYSDPNLPLVNVTWSEIIDLANQLSILEDLEPCFPSGQEESLNLMDCSGYRPPTEAEWEYIARGGSYDLYSGTSNSSDFWNINNSESTLKAPCLHESNRFV